MEGIFTHSWIVHYWRNAESYETLKSMKKQKIVTKEIYYKLPILIPARAWICKGSNFRILDFKYVYLKLNAT